MDYALRRYWTAFGSSLAVVLTLLIGGGAHGLVRAAEVPTLPAPGDLLEFLRGEQADLEPLLKSDADLAPYAEPIAAWLKEGAPTKREPKVRQLEAAMRVLARAGEKAADAAPLARKYLLDVSWDSRGLRLACAGALRAFGERGVTEAGLVVKDFTPERGPAVWAVVHAFGAQAQSLLPALVENLERSEDTKAQLMLWEVIAEFPPGCLDACTARLIKVIDDGKVPKHAKSPYQTVVRGTNDLQPYRKDILRWIKDEKHLRQGSDVYAALALCSDDQELVDALACRAQLLDGADAIAVAEVVRLLRSRNAAKFQKALLAKDPASFAAREALLGLAECGDQLADVRKEVLQMLGSGDEDVRAAATRAIAVVRKIDPELSHAVVRIVRDAGAKTEALQAEHLRQLKSEAEKVAEAKNRLAAEGGALNERESYELKQTVKNEDAVRRKSEAELQAGIRKAALPVKLQVWARALRARMGDQPDECRADLWQHYAVEPRTKDGKPEWPHMLSTDAVTALLVAGKPGPKELGEIRTWHKKAELPEDRVAVAGLLAAWDEGRADQLKVLEEGLRSPRTSGMVLQWAVCLGKNAAPLLPALRQFQMRQVTYIGRVEAALAIWQMERAEESP